MEVAQYIINGAAVITALSVILGVVISVYKIYENNKRQTVVIQRIQKEQRIIVNALKGALEGLIEQGCNGPCKTALKDLNNYLNEEAHNAEM